MCTPSLSRGTPTPPSASRRGFLFKLGLGLNALGAVLVGIPVIGYILAPARKASATDNPASASGVASTSVRPMAACVPRELVYRPL